jgi:signal transduction histidine kinase
MENPAINDSAVMLRTVRALTALSQCCQALVQLHEEPELLDRVCQIIVSAAGYRMAWVGLAESGAEQSVRPVAEAGFEAGYLQGIQITWADAERGHGPTGTAIRTAMPCVVKDIHTSPSFAPWRAAALARGFESVVGLPLISEGVVLGAVTIYAAEADAFDQNEVGLLRELADSLAYGMTALRTRAAQRRAEELLRESYQELENRVALRTRELAAAIEQLLQEAGQRTRAEQALRREKQALRQLLEVYEKHRQLIAYEIHDGVIQSVTGALMGLEGALQSLPRESQDPQRQGFDRVIRLLREGLAEARRVMGGLRPMALDDAGLLPAIQDLVCEASKDKTLTIDCSLEVRFQRLAPPLETAVFRIVQEGLTNACRYSHSAKVRVALMQQGDLLRVEIEDWGVGFDPEKVDSTHFGLQGIHQRARIFGGTASIESQPGGGTRITAELPIVEAGQPADSR